MYLHVTGSFLQMFSGSNRCFSSPLILLRVLKTLSVRETKNCKWKRSDLNKALAGGAIANVLPTHHCLHSPEEKKAGFFTNRLQYFKWKNA
jgi:hypothetical protein